MILGLILAFLAGTLFGGILGLHSAKMRSMAQTVDEEFRAAEQSLKAKMIPKQPTNAVSGQPAKPEPTIAELAAQLGSQPPLDSPKTPPKS